MSGNVLPPRNQRRAIAALLASKSLTEAATACGLSVKTLQRYLLNVTFRAELVKAETETINEAGRRLLAGQTQALEVLENMMTRASKDSDRRQAATTWLDFTLQWRELRNVEERLAVLEAAIYGHKKET